jgi:hypothetical protein
LVDNQYRRDYHTWKSCLDANTRATEFLVDHLRDPSNQVKETPVYIRFVPTARATELRWWNRYFNTYHSFDDLILFRGYYRHSYFNQRFIRTVSWHTGKSAQDIYATALTILQVGLPAIRLPPNPDFKSLSPEEKDRIYQDLHYQIDSLNLRHISFAHRALSNLRHISFAHRALSCGDTGSALELGLDDQEFVIAFVCRFQVVLLHRFNNFLTINDLRQILLD